MPPAGGQEVQQSDVLVPIQVVKDLDPSSSSALFKVLLQVWELVAVEGGVVAEHAGDVLGDALRVSAKGEREKSTSLSCASRRMEKEER